MKSCVKFTCDKFLEDRADFNSWITVLSKNLNDKKGQKRTAFVLVHKISINMSSSVPRPCKM